MKYAAKFGLSSSLLAVLVAGVVAGCGSSGSTPTGAAGTSGAAGTGAAGTGAAGTGAAGTGAAGTGAAGTGAAGTGAAGTGAAGTGAAGTGAAGTGAAGTGAAGTGAAGTGTDGGAGTGAAGTGANPDAGNSDAGGGNKTATATIAPFGTGTVKGTAVFTEMGVNVQIKVDVTDCPEGVHPLHIHAGTGCATMNEQGMHWDVPRGEMIGPGTITCAADKTGTLTYTRMSNVANLKWTVGDGSGTDVVGHAFVIHAVGAGATERVGCGVIKQP